MGLLKILGKFGDLFWLPEIKAAFLRLNKFTNVCVLKNKFDIDSRLVNIVLIAGFKSETLWNLESRMGKVIALLEMSSDNAGKLLFKKLKLQQSSDSSNSESQLKMVEEWGHENLKNYSFILFLFQVFSWLRSQIRWGGGDSEKILKTERVDQVQIWMNAICGSRIIAKMS